MDAVIRQGDCLELIKEVPTGSVGLVLTDPPYGTTAAAWDTPVPWDRWWGEVWRVLKPGRACVCFGCGQFTPDLIASQRKAYRYKWVWLRGARPTGFLDAPRRPLRVHEDVLVFCEGMPDDWPQKVRGAKIILRRAAKRSALYSGHEKPAPVRESDERYPVDVLEFDASPPTERDHPTQKPAELLRYLIKTYSAAGDLVLDTFAGSGSCGVAAVGTGRRFIGFERDPAFASIAKRNVEGEGELFRQG